MKLKAIVILAIILVAFFSCDKSSIGTKDGKLITHTLCKNEKSAIDSNNETCVEYSYNETDKTLNLKHINVVFNCCPDRLYSNIKIENNTIIIEESERKNECSCMCLYDIETEAYNIEAKKYVVKYIEQYIGNYDELIFEIDLSKKTEGSFCMERTSYPYNTD